MDTTQTWLDIGVCFALFVILFFGFLHDSRNRE